MLNDRTGGPTGAHEPSARRGRGSSRIVAIALAIGLALLAAGCGGSGGSADNSSKDSLTIAVTAEPTDWNYLRNPSLTIRQVLMLNVLEPLLEKDDSGKLKPLVAESYTVSNDGLVYTFKIREASFSDGKPVTADDVVYSLEQAKATELQDVSGRLQAVKQISKTDDRTVTVTLSEPSQKFLEAMSTDSAAIIPQGSAETLTTSPVGTGPFVFENWKQGVAVDFTRNDHYWGTEPALKTVNWRFMGDDATTVINALRAGDVDMVGNFWGNKTQIESVVGKSSGFAENAIAGPTMVYMSLNAKDPAFADLRVRQAIAYSIDRQAFIDGTNSSGDPACVFVNPPNVPWKSDYCPYPHDAAKAKQLLTDAGEQGLTLNYTYLTGTEDGVTIIAKGLEDAGFKVEREGLDFPAYSERVFTNAQYQITHIGGPQQIDAWTCPGFFTQDCYPEMDDLLTRADQASDASEWADLRRQAVEKDADRAYLIPLFTSNLIDLHQEDLDGLKSFTSAGETDLRGIHWGTS